MAAPIDIARLFCGSAATVAPLGNGHINDTLLATKDDGSFFVLQKINARVFPQPALIVSNLEKLDRHIAQTAPIDAPLTIPKLIPTETGYPFHIDESGHYWRALSYIDNTESLETLAHTSQAGQIGLALGQFHRLTRDLDAAELDDTLPGFHIAPNYLTQYYAVTKVGLKAEDRFCADFIRRHEAIVHDLEGAKAQGMLPVRTIHGDPKLNNFLFDKDSGRVVSLIDLDTVKPGLIHYDIGDCIRSACHELQTNAFNLEVCNILLTAYVQVMRTDLSEYDFTYLYPAIRLIPFELGLRFYTDYLHGNRYFKVSAPDENLQRAQQQFELCRSIMKEEQALKGIIAAVKAQC